MKNYEDHRYAVTEVCAKAGDAIIFSETCTHGTLPWKGRHQRRALLCERSVQARPCNL